MLIYKSYFLKEGDINLNNYVNSEVRLLYLKYLSNNNFMRIL